MGTVRSGARYCSERIMLSEASLQMSSFSLGTAGPFRSALEHRLSVSPMLGRKMAPESAVHSVLPSVSEVPVMSTSPSRLVSARMSALRLLVADALVGATAQDDPGSRGTMPAVAEGARAGLVLVYYTSLYKGWKNRRLWPGNTYRGLRGQAMFGGASWSLELVKTMGVYCSRSSPRVWREVVSTRLGPRVRCSLGLSNLSPIIYPTSDGEASPKDQPRASALPDH